MKPGEGTASSQIEQPGRTFGSIESSEEYVALLLQAVEETAADVGEDLRRPEGPLGRQREALQLIAYKLEQLHFHLTTGRRRLSDLRTLRRILEGDPSRTPLAA